MNARESGAADVGENDEARKLRDTVRVLAAEREKFSSNIDNV